MPDKTEFNFIDAIASYFGPYLTDFSKAIGSPHATVVNWQRTNDLPTWRRQQILDAARKLPVQNRLEIKSLLDWGIS